MRIVIASSEAVPFAKTGGLADVATGLSKALAELGGHEVSLILPCHRRFIPAEQRGEVVAEVTVPVGERDVSAKVLRTSIAGSGVNVYLIDQPNFFDRGALYTEAGFDYADNAERFLFFSRAVLDAARALDLRPDVVHANDWQTGIVPAVIADQLRGRPGFERVGTVLTIHNLAFQGQFPSWKMPLTGLPEHYFNWRQLEFYGGLNLLKAGIAFADMVTTVSPTYAREICHPDVGCGLDAMLAARGETLVGVLNGVDTSVWNPASDPFIPQNYNVESFIEGKAACKQELQREFGLPERPEAMVWGMVSRLTDQKGLDLITARIEELLQADVQLVFLGTGSDSYEERLSILPRRFPEQVATYIGFDESLAHRIEAGSDAYLMPSRFEPCGLNQQYSLIYGTVPLVHQTGGLADSVVDAQPGRIADGTANGFQFDTYDADAFLQTVWRAVGMFQHHRDDWNQLVRNGMHQDWSWRRSAERYVEVYEEALRRSTI